MNVFLIRHGEKDLIPGDPGLTQTGITQAKQTGVFLKQFRITRIIASPFKRTLQTAHQISEQLEIPYETHEALEERMNWKDETITRRQFLKEWVKATNNRDYQPLYGISSRQTGNRIEKFISSDLKEGDSMVLVSHGGAIVDYLRNLFGDEALHILRTQYEDGQDYQMMHCAVNHVFLSDNPRIELLNYTDHLSDTSE